MPNNLIWITGASSGIGRALVRSVPWSDARVVGVGRRPVDGIDHLQADLADPGSWAALGEELRSELAGFDGDRVVFIHSAGTLDPIGFAAEVDPAAYQASLMLNGLASQAWAGSSWPPRQACRQSEPW